MLLNVISVCIRKPLQVAMRFLNYLDVLIPETDLYERMLISIIRALYSYKVGNSHALSDIEQCLSLEFLDSFGVAKLKLSLKNLPITIADVQIKRLISKNILE